MKKEIIKKLINDFPQLKNEVNSTIYDFSEIYLHLIFGDIFNPYLIDLLENPIINYNQLTKAGNLLEYMLLSSEEIQEVVVTTVLERISDDPTNLLKFREFAGKNTKKYINELL